ncbi:hypothetical protein BDQ12DRAFT_718135 [Crucibulum laeve]|uniref:Uncharacterized protein n=1 Tax=Crucibulum laeve TaxID=68775 RepID=A0A5C3MJE1_9AGAR|nr:hypothetical protein BDQ12DRAFT_718135 [Crucibulum laeve]
MAWPLASWIVPPGYNSHFLELDRTITILFYFILLRSAFTHDEVLAILQTKKGCTIPAQGFIDSVDDGARD